MRKYILEKGKLEIDCREALHLLIAFVAYKHEQDPSDFTEDGLRMINQLETKLYKIHDELGRKFDKNPTNKKLSEEALEAEAKEDGSLFYFN